jgi:hypothetical protein
MHGAFGVALHEACRMQGSEVEASFVYLVSLRHRLPTQSCLLRFTATLLLPDIFMLILRTSQNFL